MLALSENQQADFENVQNIDRQTRKTIFLFPPVITAKRATTTKRIEEQYDNLLERFQKTVRSNPIFHIEYSDFVLQFRYSMYYEIHEGLFKIQ